MRVEVFVGSCEGSVRDMALVRLVGTREAGVVVVSGLLGIEGACISDHCI